MMKLSCPRLLALGLMLVSSLSAGTRETAFQARALLGPGVWSRVLRIENDRAGRDSRYPAEFHGLVVAFEGFLWLYTELDGTQTFSLYRGRLAADQADPGPLLRAIEPGLARFEDVTDRPPALLPAGRPPRSCFLAAVVRWRQLQGEPVAPTRARMIAYYQRTKTDGHMVLEFWRGGRRYVFDPDQPAADHELPGRLAEDPLKVARSLYRPGAGNGPVRATHFDLGRA